MLLSRRAISRGPFRCVAEAENRLVHDTLRVSWGGRTVSTIAMGVSATCTWPVVDRNVTTYAKSGTAITKLCKRQHGTHPKEASCYDSVAAKCCEWRWARRNTCVVTKQFRSVVMTQAVASRNWTSAQAQRPSISRGNRFLPFFFRRKRRRENSANPANPANPGTRHGIKGNTFQFGAAHPNFSTALDFTSGRRRKPRNFTTSTCSGPCMPKSLSCVNPNERLAVQ